METQIEFISMDKSHIEVMMKDIVLFPDTLWINRFTYFKNIGLKDDKDVGHYHSAMTLDLPKDFRRLADKVSKGLSQCPLAEVMVNRYEENDFIPNHIDLQGFLDLVVIPLTDNPNQGFTYIDRDGKEVFCQDSLGTAIRFIDLKTVHSVKPISGKTRYSLILLFGVEGLSL